MKADPQAQRLLLEVQAIDTALAQLAHRRAHLPQIAELADLGRRRDELEQERLRIEGDLEQLDRDIARVEREVEKVRDRKERDAARLASGSGPARELEALQHEIVSLERRQQELEDDQLELMERRELTQTALDEVTAQLAETERRREATEASRDEALAEITAEEEVRRAARGPLVAQLPADLVALYERIREEQGGIGAAPLRGGRCGGCRLELSGSEKARVRAAPPDEVLRCEECRRIMVRDAESGL